MKYRAFILAAFLSLCCGCDERQPPSQTANSKILWEADYSKYVDFNSIPWSTSFGNLRWATVEGKGAVRIRFPNDLTLSLDASKVDFTAEKSKLTLISIDSVSMSSDSLRDLIKATSAQCGVDLKGLQEWHTDSGQPFSLTNYSRSRYGEGYGISIETVPTLQPDAPYLMRVTYGWIDRTP